MPQYEPKIGFVSLGCPKALVDSEQILSRLRAEGYGIVGDYAGADLVVVNTCGFIDAAVEESLDAIGEAVSANGKVVVTGCLGARAEQIRAAHPEVVAITGPHAFDSVMAAVHKHLPQPHDPYISLLPPQGIKLTPRHYAYLKISEGCNHRCSFCIIPQLRGDLRSYPIGEVLDQAAKLAAAGVRELLVVSQDTSAYGVDSRYRTGFWRGRPLKSDIRTLAAALGELGIWVRLHYVYPYPHVDRLIPLMAEGRLLPYLDTPLQHASPAILKAMRRPANAENMLARIRHWREICPEITLRSTFIVGFPGETEDDFERLLEFLDAAQLDRVGCFAYSPVDGAPANELADPIAPELQQERLERFMTHQAAISTAKLRRKVGSRQTVLLDAISEDGYGIARSRADAPEIDGLVYIEDGAELPIGEFIEVRIHDSDEYDLFAHIDG